jgi:hypothetical protein
MNRAYKTSIIVSMVLFSVGVTKCTSNIIEASKNSERTNLVNKVTQVLDTDKNGLSTEEIKRFYDETELTPYNEDAFESNSIEDFKKFLSQYELKPVRKQ